MGYTAGYTTNKTYTKQYSTREPILGLWKDGTYTCLEVQRKVSLMNMLLWIINCDY